MKTIFALALAAFSVSISARAADIAALSCLASNGVSLKGEAAPGAPLKVTSTWGVYTKEFVATLAGTTTDKLNVSLASKEGPSYVLSLANPTKTHNFGAAPVASVSGTILQLSTERGQEPAVVAYVRCDLRLR